MDELRINRIRSAMKDELSVLINRELRDPRVPHVTITDVKMTRDAKQATVFVSILGFDQTHSDPEEMKVCLEGLQSAKGFLKREITRRVGLRMSPDLLFKEDKGLENTLRVNELLKQITPAKPTPESD